MEVAAETRWESHRRNGTPLPFVDEKGDAIATSAEAIVADLLGVPWHPNPTGHADPGWDMVFRGWKVDVKNAPAGKKMLLVKTWKPVVDIYVLVLGGKPVGWEWGSVMERMWAADFGFTHGPHDEPDISYFRPYWDLMPLDVLLDLPERGFLDNPVR